MALWKGIVLMESRVLAGWVSMKDQPFPREVRNTGGMMRRTTNRKGKRSTAEESTPSGMRAVDGVAECLFSPSVQSCSGNDVRSAHLEAGEP